MDRQERNKVEKNYLVRRMELMKKVRRDFHRPTRAEKDPKAYCRKQKHRVGYMEMNGE